MWDKRFGGNDDDFLYSIQQTSDGGFILGGRSSSGISGDKTQAMWGSCDYWIVKTDSLGNKQWDKNFGGTAVDWLTSIKQTRDGGYILGGYSVSGIGGDKSQGSWGGTDFWIIKTDSLGNKQWDKDFGGIDADNLYSIQQTKDGGFIFGGYSWSGISGDKTQPNQGSWDYWIVKTDSLGNKQWDKDFGGSIDDWFTTIQQTSDNGYIFGGHSQSGISGDKTQPTWGLYDYWIVKTDSLGNKQWDKDFGGDDLDELFSIQQTDDDGFILGGFSRSGISGDKSQPTWGGLYDTDYWIIKTDSLGNKQWDKDYGGIYTEDDFQTISQVQQGGYLLAGTSYSPASGYKTEPNLGLEQMWVLNVDSVGNVLWDKTIFTSGHDEWGMAIQTSDDCYLMANHTSAGVAGYKTHDAWNGTLDYWIIKFCDTTLLPIVALTVSNQICPGTCIDYINLSVYANSYQWNFPGANPDTSTAINPTTICYPSPGSYDVQLIATNANGSDTLLLTNYITVYPTPPAQSITQIGDTLFAIAGTGIYQWYFNGNIINGATDYFYVATSSGDYNVIATDSNGCEVEAVINNVVAEIQFAVGSSQLAVFPNPVKDKFTIHDSQFTSGTAVEISIYNVLGERVLNQESRTKIQEEIIDVSMLENGLYYLEVTSGEKIYRSKFVKL